MSAFDLPSSSSPPIELAYTQFTSVVSPTATSEATANTIVTAASVTLNGSETVLVEFYCPTYGISVTTIEANISLFQSFNAGAAASIGKVWRGRTSTAAVAQDAIYIARRLATPAAGAYVWSFRGWLSSAGTLDIVGGAGGAGNDMPGFIRVSLVT